MTRALATPARLRAATAINDASNPAYQRGRDRARRELARELRRLHKLRLKYIAREIKHLREWPNIPEADRARRRGTARDRGAGGRAVEPRA